MENGYDTSRLDRIERILEVVVTIQQDVQQEHRNLLRSQVLMQDELRRLAEAQKQADERMSALIVTVDSIIRANPRP